MHGGGPHVVAGIPLPKSYITEELKLTEDGCENMQVHIRNCLKFGVNVLVAINKFTTDTQNEIEIVKKKAIEVNKI